MYKELYDIAIYRTRILSGPIIFPILQVFQRHLKISQADIIMWRNIVMDNVCILPWYMSIHRLSLTPSLEPYPVNMPQSRISAPMYMILQKNAFL